MSNSQHNHQARASLICLCLMVLILMGLYVDQSDLLTINSGKDTTLSGAQLTATQVKANIGGNLNIVTLQDKSSYDSKQTSAGFNVSVCIPPLCYGTAVTGGINYSKNTLNHNYLSAVGQSGINAGTEGFQIKVGGNTSLTGAALTSTAEQSKNSLQTASIDYNDLINKESTAAGNTSLSLSTSNVASNIKDNVMSNLAGQATLPKTGASQSDTKSVISPATITITGTGTGTGDTHKDQASKDAAATLTSRDATTANASLKNTLSLQQVTELEAKQRQMAENLAAANAVGSVVTNMIGDYAKSKNDALQAQENAKAKAEGRKPVEVQSWNDSSAEKILLHGLAGAIQAKLGGTNVVSGAVAGSAKEALTDVMSSYLVSQGIGVYQPDPKLSEAENKAKAKADADNYNSLMNLGSSLVGAATGAAVGGNIQNANAGANIGLIADQNNRQLHQSEIKRLAALTGEFQKRLKAQGIEISDQEAFGRLLAQAAKDVDTVQFKDRENDVIAEAFISLNRGTSFTVNGKSYATFQAQSEDEKQDHTIFKDSADKYAALY
ncbi:MAG: hemagglutinin repeat-containing protein, partial [Burkholderiales bacterium]|nr:hemagglutinin repeat-containing protein [Burkholderiales bacterium]